MKIKVTVKKSDSEVWEIEGTEEENEKIKGKVKRLLEKIKCGLCGSENYDEREGVTKEGGFPYNIRECLSCHAVSKLVRPKDAAKKPFWAKWEEGVPYTPGEETPVSTVRPIYVPPKPKGGMPK